MVAKEKKKMPKIGIPADRGVRVNGQTPRKSGVAGSFRSLLFHGLELAGSPQAEGDCPFCGKEKKLRANVETGLWDCKSCGASGNPLEFLRQLWEASAYSEAALIQLANDRRLLDWETLVAWGVRISHLTADYLLPGYSPDGRLSQLYRYCEVEGRWRMLATPDFGQQLFGPAPFSTTKDASTVHVTEGPWDGMALWETLRAAGVSNEAVIAVPSCTIFKERWAQMFRGRTVNLLFDSDHPKLHPTTKKQVGLQGYKGMLRAAAIIHANTKAAKVNLIKWGPGGHDPGKPSGWDLRDHLSQADTARQRVALWQQLQSRLEVAPTDGGGELSLDRDGHEIGCEPCSSWKELVNSWRKAMKWDKPGEGLDAMLSVCLASVLTTETRGPQLWVLPMGPPSSGKTEICDGITTNTKYALAKSLIRGFHSGFDASGKGEEDNSLLALMLGKTLVTKDGDMLLQAPNKEQILGEARDIFDRKTSVHYRNKVCRAYDKLSAGWILAGTAAMRVLDTSDLGERFIRLYLSAIDDETEGEIGWMSVNRTDEECCYMMHEELPENGVARELERAKALTGGYITHLRENAKAMMNSVEFSDARKRQCQHFGWFAAYLRSRPNVRQTEIKERERHYRLANQMTKLARAVAAVTNRASVDDSVMKVVRKAALDTAKGRTLDIASHLFRTGRKGLDGEGVTMWTGQDGEGETKLLRFLQGIGAIERFRPSSMIRCKERWRLTDKMTSLYQEVIGDAQS